MLNVAFYFLLILNCKNGYVKIVSIVLLKD